MGSVRFHSYSTPGSFVGRSGCAAGTKGTGAKSQSAVGHREIVKDNIGMNAFARYAGGLTWDMLDEIVDLIQSRIRRPKDLSAFAGDVTPPG